MIAWNNLYYGNTVQEWAIALAIVLGAIIGGKIVYWIIGTFVKKIVARTKTKLDDLIVDMAEEPLVFAISLAGIWFAFHTLTTSETIATWFTNGFQAVLVLNIAWLLARLFDALFTEYMIPITKKSRSDFDDHIVPMIKRGVKMIIWILAVLVALNNAGYNIGALLAGLGIGGLAFAMAAKDFIANIFGGITILTDKPFKMKDRIQIGDWDGKVIEIGLRSTRLETLAGRMVTIPNHFFSENAVENISSEPSRKVTLDLGLTYDTTPAQMQKAMKLLTSIAKKNKHVDDDVKISFDAFNDSSMNIKFIYYIIKGSDILETQTEMDLEILSQFNKNKLEFAFPTRTVYTMK